MHITLSSHHIRERIRVHRQSRLTEVHDVLDLLEPLLDHTPDQDTDLQEQVDHLNEELVRRYDQLANLLAALQTLAGDRNARDAQWLLGRAFQQHLHLTEDEAKLTIANLLGDDTHKAYWELHEQIIRVAPLLCITSLTELYPGVEKALDQRQQLERQSAQLSAQLQEAQQLQELQQAEYNTVVKENQKLLEQLKEKEQALTQLKEQPAAPTTDAVDPILQQAPPKTRSRKSQG